VLFEFSWWEGKDSNLQRILRHGFTVRLLHPICIPAQQKSKYYPVAGLRGSYDPCSTPKVNTGRNTIYKFHSNQRSWVFQGSIEFPSYPCADQYTTVYIDMSRKKLKFIKTFLFFLMIDQSMFQDFTSLIVNFPMLTSYRKFLESVIPETLFELLRW
jgi:hypothetical protein